MKRTVVSVSALLALAGCAAESGSAVVEAAPAAVERASAELTQRRVDELVRRLSPKLSRSPAGLAWEEHAHGRAHVHLQERFQHAVIARREGDGRVTTQCVHSPQAARAALAPQPSGRR